MYNTIQLLFDCETLMEWDLGTTGIAFFFHYPEQYYLGPRERNTKRKLRNAKIIDTTSNL